MKNNHLQSAVLVWHSTETAQRLHNLNYVLWRAVSVRWFPHTAQAQTPCITTGYAISCAVCGL